MAGALYVSNPLRGKNGRFLKRSGAKSKRGNPVTEEQAAAIGRRAVQVETKRVKDRDAAQQRLDLAQFRRDMVPARVPVLVAEREARVDLATQKAEDRRLARALRLAQTISAPKGDRVKSSTRRRKSAPRLARDRKGRFLPSGGAKKAAPRKAAPRKAAPRKAASRRAAPRKAAPRKAASRRAAPRKAAGRRKGSSRQPRRDRKGRFLPRGRGGRRVNNPLTITNPMGGVPILGTALSMIGPAFFAVIGVEAIGQLHSAYARWGPEGGVPEMIQPVTYTIGGLILSGTVQLLTFIPAPYRNMLSVALASAGASVDWYRYRSANGAYGDLQYGEGGNWEVVGQYGDLQIGDDDEAFGDLQIGDLEDFAGDEDFDGADFSQAEGEAAYEGYGAFARRFPPKRGPAARAARGQEGQRKHWLARLVGPADFKKVARMAPAQRVQMIAACKDAARAYVGGSMAPAAPPPAQIEMARPMPQPIHRAKPAYDYARPTSPMDVQFETQYALG